MRDRWFHAPTLHTASHQPRQTSWLELIYDLVFVAGMIQLGDAVAAQRAVWGPVGAVFWFVVFVSPMWIAWTGFTFYSNRYTVDDILHRLLVFLHMLATAGMAVTGPTAMSPGGDQVPFTLAYSVAQGVLAVMFWRALRHTEEGKPYSRYWAVMFAAGAVVWALALLVSGPARLLVWLFGITLIVLSPLAPASRALQDGYPIDQGHLSERYGLLTIVVLGEGFLKLFGEVALSPRATEPFTLLCGAGLVVITIGVWWIYFDDVAGARLREGRARWLVWLYAHLPMGLCLVGLGIGGEAVMRADPSAVITASQRWLLAGNLAGVFAAVASIDRVTERRHTELSDAWHARVRTLFAALFLLLAAGVLEVSVLVFVGLCAGMCLSQVVLDMLMAPQLDEDAPASALTSAAQAEQQRLARERRERRQQRLTVAAPVRRGAPPELRDDLYFWLMDGSWLRLVGLVVSVYLMSNAAFAGLYLLEDGAIAGAGPGSFLDAFAFSVQTMSTIGYGVFSPAGSYAHLLVTVEAAMGMLGVALATGLIFAKVSRPEAKLLFSDPFVVSTLHGRTALLFRVANTRGNELVDASVTAVLVRDERSVEGHELQRIDELELVSARAPVFRLFWTVAHVVDERSPLRDVDWSRLDQARFDLVLLVSGHDVTYAQTVHARHVYQAVDARVGHRFVPVESSLPDGRLLADYTHMHDTVGEAEPG